MSTFGEIDRDSMAAFALSQKEPSARHLDLIRLGRLAAPGVLSPLYVCNGSHEHTNGDLPAHSQRLLRHNHRMVAGHRIDEMPGWMGVIVVLRTSSGSPFDAHDAGVLSLANAELLPLAVSRWRQSSAAKNPEGDATDRLARLSVMQRKVLELMADGLTEADAAKQLHRSPHTIHEHVRNIYAALGVRSRVELVKRFGGML